jgi:fructose-bisphosphate aldolase class II
MTATIRKKFYEDPGNFDPRNYLGPARDAIREMVRHKLHVLGCAGRVPLA